MDTLTHYLHSKEEEFDIQAQECAVFLMTLKHRSVTPEPWDDEVDTVGSTSDSHSFYGQPEGLSFIEPMFPKSISTTTSTKKDISYDSDGSSITNKTPSLADEEAGDDEDQESIFDEDISIEGLICDSKLIKMEDRDLVPDALLVAMAQMRPCQLTEADKIGCYKNRDVGFTGLCCKHCGGSPGFGQYFPATTRSLAQTTTSQTILKHIGSKCRNIPIYVRRSVLELQRQQTVKEEEKAKAPEAGRPRYGSRKVFFQRVWDRLHDGNDVVVSTTITKKQQRKPKTQRKSSSKRVVSDSSASSSAASTPVQSDDEQQNDPPRPPRNSRFGRLPLKKSVKKRRQQSLQVSGNKRFKRSA